MDIAGLTLTPTSADFASWRFDDDQRLTGVAGPSTDLFVDPASGTVTVNAPRLLAPAPPGDFQLSADVAVDFRSTFDAGALLLWVNERTWAKLAFEYAPQRHGMAVSVVTRGLSDDGNGYLIHDASMRLRICRVGGAYAFHAGLDGKPWSLLRHFSLGTTAASIGFEVQSPTGPGCTATFTTISYQEVTLADLRDGS